MKARPPRPGDAVIVISHTGETAYARRVRQQALDAQIPVVSITGPGAGWPEAIVTPVRERSETYTVSYTAALAVLALLAHDLGASGTGPDALDAVARRVDAIIDDPGIGHLRPPERAMALVGAGPWHVTAREAALKLREAGHLLCEGFDAERLLHGAAVPYRRGDLLVALQPSADPDGLVAAVTAAAADQGIEVATVEEAEIPASPVLAQSPSPSACSCSRPTSPTCLEPTQTSPSRAAGQTIVSGRPVPPPDRPARLLGSSRNLGHPGHGPAERTWGAVTGPSCSRGLDMLFVQLGRASRVCMACTARARRYGPSGVSPSVRHARPAAAFLPGGGAAAVWAASGYGHPFGFPAGSGVSHRAPARCWSKLASRISSGRHMPTFRRCARAGGQGGRNAGRSAQPCAPARIAA